MSCKKDCQQNKQIIYKVKCERSNVENSDSDLNLKECAMPNDSELIIQYPY